MSARVADPGAGRLADELVAPVRVGVTGRAGGGRRTVARALAGAGMAVAEPADVDVHLLTETLKPEDLHAIGTASRPTVVILNKADLAGFGGDGPVAAAARRCLLLGELAGTTVYPLAGLAAAAALDDTVVDDALVGALRVLGVDPADLGSTDRFVRGEHRVPHAVRQRLLAELDLFGIAHGVRAVRDVGSGEARHAVRVALRRASGVDAVLAAITAAAAPVRYLRLTRALSALGAAVAIADTGADPIAEFLAGDDVIAARMAAATQVVEAVGMTVDRDRSRAAHLRRAVLWQRYSRGPVSPLQGRCGADIARGSLRLWERAGGVAEALG
ncbi:hypothetical protein B1R94_01365 [Mycolicibacterium litorale]|nr:hypothetical protein B1R94_01365 [Mycolicibacterium litorale]